MSQITSTWNFKVSKIAYAALPALRVTAYGAAAYARYYNRRLPTDTEWLHALGNGDSHADEPSNDGGDSPEETTIQFMPGMMQPQAKSDSLYVTGNTLAVEISWMQA